MSLSFQVLSEENQREIVEFCKQEGLVLLADEVGETEKLFTFYIFMLLTFNNVRWILYRYTKKMFMYQRRSSIPSRKLPDLWGTVRRIYPLYPFSQSLKVNCLYIYF